MTVEGDNGVRDHVHGSNTLMSDGGRRSWAGVRIWAEVLMKAPTTIEERRLWMSGRSEWKWNVHVGTADQSVCDVMLISDWKEKLTWQWAMNTRSEFIIEGVTCSSQWSLFIVENKEKNLEKKTPSFFPPKLPGKKTSCHNLKLSSVIFPIRKKKTWYSNRTKPTECACRQWTTTALACGRNSS